MWYLFFLIAGFFSIGFVYQYYVNPIAVKTFPVEKEVPQIVGSVWRFDSLDYELEIMRCVNEQHTFEIQKLKNEVFEIQNYTTSWIFRLDEDKYDGFSIRNLPEDLVSFYRKGKNHENHRN